MNTQSPEMPENIAETLLQGSRNIDRMRKDINDLVSMLRGLLRTTISGQSEKINLEFCYPPIKWEIRGEYPIPEGWETRLKFDAWITKKNNVCMSAWSSCNPHIRNTSEIQQVYESLPLLVKSMAKEFPELDGKFAPFIAAARIQFPD